MKSKLLSCGVLVVAILIGVSTYGAKLIRLGWILGIWPMIMFSTYDIKGEKVKLPGNIASTKWYDDIMEWNPKDDDVIIVTFPKSGTHFSMQLVVQTLGDGERDFESIHHVISVPEFEGLNPENCGDPKIMTHLNYKDLEPDRRGAFASHLTPKMLMRDSGTKYILMVRNPVDVLLSMYKMSGKMMGAGAPTLEELFKYSFTEMTFGYAEYNLRWWKEHEKFPDRVQILFYEDALTNLTNTVVQIADFLGKSNEWDESEYWGIIEKIRYRSSLEYMKPRKQLFEPPECVEILPGVKSNNADMVNKGKAGRGKKQVPVELQERVWDYYKKSLEGTTFPWERYYPKDD